MNIDASALLNAMQETGVNEVKDLSQFAVNDGIASKSSKYEVNLIPEVIDRYIDSIVARNVVFIQKSLLRLPKDIWSTAYNGFHVCNTSRKLDKLTILIDRFGTKNIGVSTLLRWLANPIYVHTLMNDTTNHQFIQDFVVNKESMTEQELFVFLSLLKAYQLPIGGRFIVYRDGVTDIIEVMKNIYNEATRIYGVFIKGKSSWRMYDCINEWTSLTNVNVASFTAGCLCTDWLYNNIETCTDSMTYAGFGNGADKGITYITGNRKRYSEPYRLSVAIELLKIWQENAERMVRDVLGRTTLTEDSIDALSKENNLPNPLTMLRTPTLQDVEHWLCEFYKLSAMQDNVTRRRLAKYNNRGVSI